MAGRLRKSRKGLGSKEFQTSHAFIVGINGYRHGVPALRSAENDARKLADLLSEKHGYVTHLFTEDVTRVRLAQLFAEIIPDHVSEHDRALFYFAGHGVALEGEEGPEGYLLPQDASPDDNDSFLSMREVGDWLQALTCRHLLVILDCCFAGAFRWASTREVNTFPSIIHQELYERFVREPAWQVLTSTAYDQKALDTVAGQVIGVREVVGTSYPHSPFALALFDALEGAADVIPRDGGDGIITATELFLFLRDQVERGVAHYHNQTPGLWPLRREYDKGEYIFIDPNGMLNLPPAPELTFENNPYRGLKSYERVHGSLFFGRDEEIQELAARVSAQPFTAVIGASGTGKSSLVKAGLLPYLDPPSAEGDGDLESSGRWHILPPMRPGATPTSNLHALLMDELYTYATPLTETQFNADASALADLVAAWQQELPGSRLLLIVDQLEELITLCQEAERIQFLALLAQAIERQPETFSLIITLRTDFEPQFDAHVPLAPHWQPARYAVPPMDQADLRRVIEGPASERVLYFESPELVDALITEVIQTPGALPLLSFTLSEMYVYYLKSRRDNRALMQADYDALGGVIGSLRNRASEEYATLPDEPHRETMRRVMLRMISIEGGELARRRVHRAELVYPTPEENGRVERVLERLVAARLLVMGEEQGEATVEPAHDALILAWDRLLRWKQTAEQYLPLQRRLAQAAMEWDRAELEARSGLLWDDDPRLPQLEETLWPTRGKEQGLQGRLRWALQVMVPSMETPPNTQWLNEREVSFIQASVRARASFWRRTVSITIIVMIVLAALAIYATVQANEATVAQATAEAESIRAVAAEETAVVEASRAVAAEGTAVVEANLRATEVISRTTAQAEAIVQANIAETRQVEAEEQRQIAVSRLLALQADAQLEAGLYEPALLLAIESGRAAETSEAYAALRKLLNQSGRTRLILDSRQGTLVHYMWHAAWNPQETRILTNSDYGHTGEIGVWDAQSGDKLFSFTADNQTFTGASWSPDGRRIATAGHGGVAQIWDGESGALLQAFPQVSGMLDQATWNARGDRILTSGVDFEVRIWDAETGEQLDSIPGYEAWWNTAGDRLLTTLSSDGEITVWELEEGSHRELFPLSGHARELTQATWNADGSRILTASHDGTTRVWDADTGDELLALKGHGRSVVQATWSPDENRILTAGMDGTARVWDATNGDELFVLSGHGEWVATASWHPNGNQILTAGEDGAARVWDARTGTALVILGDHSDSLRGAFWNRDGTEILTVSEDGRTRVWEMTEMPELPALSSPTGAVEQAEWSPNDGQIVTRNSDFQVHIWDADNGDEMWAAGGEEERLTGALWSASGGYLLAVAADNTVRVWDADEGQQLAVLDGHDEMITDVRWNRDGTRALTASQDGTTRVWDALNGDELLILDAEAGWLVQADWNATERAIMARSFGSPLNAIIVWDLATKNQLLTITGSWSWAAWGADESHLLLADYGEFGGPVHGWDVRQDCELFTLPASATMAALDPGRERILTAGNSGETHVWDARTGTEIATVTGYRAFWDRQGAQILTTSRDGLSRIWNASTGVELAVLAGQSGRLMQVSWDPDNRRILTVSPSGAAQVWDSESGSELFTLSDQGSQVEQAAWNADGSRILTVGVDGVVRQYYTELRALIELGCQRTRRNLTLEEWQRFMPGEEYRATCQRLPIEDAQ